MPISGTFNMTSMMLPTQKLAINPQNRSACSVINCGPRWMTWISSAPRINAITGSPVGQDERNRTTRRSGIGSEAELKQGVETAGSISYSTGPSGTHLQKLFERWGIAKEIAGRTVLAPPGVAVGSLVADGRAELGFQQLSEMIHLQGIDVLGPLPAAVQIVMVFSAALAAQTVHADIAEKWLAFLGSPEADEVKRRNGMMPGD